MAIGERSQACPLCGEANPGRFRLYYDSEIKLFQCRSCTFIAQYIGPGAVTFDLSHSKPTAAVAEREHQDSYVRRRGRMLCDTVCQIMKRANRGRILDVGCGRGYFLDLCSRKGLDCFGVEPQNDFLPTLESRFPGRIAHGRYHKDMFPSGTFDVITFVQVLEHIPDPVKPLAIARHHLKSGGLLVVEVPSVNAPHFLLYRCTGVQQFIRPPRGVLRSHVNYFSPRTLSRSATNAGFTKETMITGRWRHKYSGPLHFIARFVDPMLNLLRMGGILWMGRPQQEQHAMRDL